MSQKFPANGRQQQDVQKQFASGCCSLPLPMVAPVQTGRYLTSYRFYTLSKAGIGLAYLWYVWDFFRIHASFWGQSVSILPGPANITFSGCASLDSILRQIAIVVSGKAMVWLFLLSAPVSVGLYLWGRYRWLQFGVGCWMSFSMISLASLVGVFISTADLWINYTLVVYVLSALICSSSEWEEHEAGFSLLKWRANPTLASRYAWLVVLVQFAVYFFAGINKLEYGWTPWVTGTALQNLAYDSAMRDYVRGVPPPHWISFILCYVTLFQRLVVPFGFYFKRWRFWSVLILGAMHIGYAILMNVEIFPVIGISCLLMILPPRTSKAPQPASRSRKAKEPIRKSAPLPLFQNTVMCLISVVFLVESARMVILPATPLENKLMVVPAWRMFADGGVTSGGKWKLVLETPQGEVDGTDIALALLPSHLWRDRFYVDLIFHEASMNHVGPGSLPAKLADATRQSYAKRPGEAKAGPVVLNCGFEVYSSRPSQGANTNTGR